MRRETKPPEYELIGSIVWERHIPSGHKRLTLSMPHSDIQQWLPQGLPEMAYQLLQMAETKPKPITRRVVE